MSYGLKLGWGGTCKGFRSISNWVSDQITCLFGFRVLGFNVSGLGFKVYGLGFKVQVLGFKVWGLGYLEFRKPQNAHGSSVNKFVQGPNPIFANPSQVCERP